MNYHVSIFIDENRITGMQEAQKVRFTYLIGKLSATLIIPLEIAKKNGLNKPSDVTVEETENGILIKKKTKRSLKIGFRNKKFRLVCQIGN